MPESLQHSRLVTETIAFIRTEFGDRYAVTILDDLQSAIGAEKPPRIDGFVPDVYAQDAPVTFAVIGEAKTAADLETDHTKRQLIAYLRHLELQPLGVLVLSVPWQARATASRLVKRCRKIVGSRTSKCVIVDDVDLAGRL